MSDKKHRVMVIDDSKTIRQTMEAYLRDMGHEVMCCTDGFNGISHMITFKPDLLLIDVEMTRMNGLETVRLIRANDQFKAAPILMLSARDGMFDMALATAAGANGYLVKPPVKDEIASAIAQHLG
ncbi:PleD family two-component system response regulator [Pseudomonas tritici]|uniref:response regulator n=1 Tax=Pseudomonas tritici TaxID=2745518 RepID=UPI00387B2E1D